MVSELSDTVCAHPRFSLERCEVCIRLIPTISRPAPVHMCEDTSEDDRVPSVRHVACNQSDSRLVCISTGQREFDHTHIKFHSGLFSKRLSSSSVKVNLWFINQHRLNIVQTCNEIMCVIQAVLQHLHQFDLH